MKQVWTIEEEDGSPVKHRYGEYEIDVWSRFGSYEDALSAAQKELVRRMSQMPFSSKDAAETFAIAIVNPDGSRWIERVAEVRYVAAPCGDDAFPGRDTLPPNVDFLSLNREMSAQ